MTGMNCAQNKLKKNRKNKGKTRNPGKDFPMQLLNLSSCFIVRNSTEKQDFREVNTV